MYFLNYRDVSCQGESSVKNEISTVGRKCDFFNKSKFQDGSDFRKSSAKDFCRAVEAEFEKSLKNSLYEWSWYSENSHGGSIDSPRNLCHLSELLTGLEDFVTNKPNGRFLIRVIAPHWSQLTLIIKSYNGSFEWEAKGFSSGKYQSLVEELNSLSNWYLD